VFRFCACVGSKGIREEPAMEEQRDIQPVEDLRSGQTISCKKKKKIGMQPITYGASINVVFCCVSVRERRE